MKEILFTTDQGVLDIHYVVLHIHEMQNTRPLRNDADLIKTKVGCCGKLGTIN